MIRQYCLKNCVIRISEDHVLFYSHAIPGESVREDTTIWKYDVRKHKTEECFTVGEAGASVYDSGTDDQYLCLSSDSSRSDFIGKWSGDGGLIWKKTLNGMAGVPVFDKKGNIYLSLNAIWIYCFDKNGGLKWRWHPDFVTGRKEKSFGEIKNYFLLYDKILVFMAGGFCIVSEEGNTEKRCETAQNYNKVWMLSHNKILLLDIGDQKIICINMEGAKLWEYCLEEREKIGTIQPDEQNYIYFTVDAGSNSRLVSLDIEGKQRWELPSDCINASASMLLSERQLYLYCGKNAEVYSTQGEKLWEYAGEGSIIWLNEMEGRRVAVFQRRGNIFITQLPEDGEIEVREIKIVKEGREIQLTQDEWEEWRSELADYISRTVTLLTASQLSEKLSEVKLHYRESEYVKPEVSADGREFMDMDTLNPLNHTAGDYREEYKECNYLNIIWKECCDHLTEKDMSRMLDEVAHILEHTFRVRISVIKD